MRVYDRAVPASSPRPLPYRLPSAETCPTKPRILSVSTFISFEAIESAVPVPKNGEAVKAEALLSAAAVLEMIPVVAPSDEVQ